MHFLIFIINIIIKEIYLKFIDNIVDLFGFDHFQYALFYHKKMFTAIEKGDSKKASKFMEEHIQDLINWIMASKDGDEE